MRELADPFRMPKNPAGYFKMTPFTAEAIQSLDGFLGCPDHRWNLCRQTPQGRR
jgi:hypothetical protein